MTALQCSIGRVDPSPAAPMRCPPRNAPISRRSNETPVGYGSATPSGRPIDPGIESALQDTAKVLEGLGHDVFESAIDVDWRKLYAVQGVVSGANAAAGLTAMIERVGREPEPDDFEPLTWAGIRYGQKLGGEEVMRAWGTLRVLTRQIVAAFDDFDVFLSPVMGTIPPKVGHIDPVGLTPREVGKRQARVFPFTPPFNFTGQPAISLPLAWSQAGLPIGMQFAGRYADEATLFRLAGQLEQARPWSDRKPVVWS